MVKWAIFPRFRDLIDDASALSLAEYETTEESSLERPLVELVPVSEEVDEQRVAAVLVLLIIRELIDSFSGGSDSNSVT